MEPKSKEIIIFIIGTSAVGKTKLSLVLSEKLKNCEIINCDSMQIYKTADIMTAKATKEEQSKVKHHLLDILDLSIMNFTRNDFIEIATKQINSLLNQGKIPVVVGGTHYYVESLLFNDEEGFEELEDEKNEKEESESANDFENYELLKKIDPLMANKTHPNDKRRIRNYLKLYKKHNKLPSELFKTCESDKNLRYKDAIIFWPYMEKMDNLKEKAQVRINEMVNHEGIEEILNVYEFFCSEINKIEEIEEKVDFQKGVLQAIGYKEFFPFYKEIKKTMIEMKVSFAKMNDLQKKNLFKIIDEGINFQKILKECKEMLLIKTMKYTKKQLLWIENRFLNFKVLENRLFKLEFDSYVGNNFNDKVVAPTIKIISNFMEDFNFESLEKEFPEYLAKLKKKNYKRVCIEDWKKYFCDICNFELNGPKEWDQHVKSRRHTKKKIKLNNERFKKKESKNKIEKIENKEEQKEKEEIKKDDENFVFLKDEKDKFFC